MNVLGFRDSVDRAIHFLGGFYDVVEASKEDRKHEGLSKKGEIWKADLLIRNEKNELEEVVVFIKFHQDFPYSFPSFQLQKEFCKKIGTIPHLNSDRTLCTYRIDSADLEESQPDELLWDCIRKVITTLEEGISGENREDFEDEFLAYWLENSNANSKMLSLISEEVVGEQKLLILNPPFGKFTLALVDEGNDSMRFIDTLKFLGINSLKANVIFSEQLVSPTPPFDITVGDFFEEVKTHPDLAKIKRGINAQAKMIVRAGTLNSRLHFFSQTFPDSPKKIKAQFRQWGNSEASSLKRVMAGKVMLRDHFEELSRTRIEVRTIGESRDEHWKFVLAGLGSIGSNLLSYLDSLNFPDFELIDSERYTLDNLGRQFCDLEDVGNPKTLALSQKLLYKNPLREVKSFATSFSKYLVQDDIDLNSANCLFVQIGIPACERQIIEQIKQSKITIPTFMIWVEPFIAAGHVLYLSPGDAETYTSLHQNDKFAYNVISSHSYDCDQAQLLLKDAGCGSNYVPYGYADVTDFLAGVWKYIKRWILEPPSRSQVLTWIGDLKMVRAKGIELSEFGMEQYGLQGDVILHL